MYGLIISSEDVLSYSQQMKSLEHEVQTIFQEVNQRMSQMSSVWDSPASQSLLSQFQSLRPVFDSYVQALEEYAMYLNQILYLIFDYPHKHYTFKYFEV